MEQWQFTLVSSKEAIKRETASEANRMGKETSAKRLGQCEVMSIRMSTEVTHLCAEDPASLETPVLMCMSLSEPTAATQEK